MSQQTLKELLEPPFEANNNVRFIRIKFSTGMFVSVIELFPLGYQYINKIMDMDTVEKDKFISELSDFTVAALNEKWERDFGERSDDPEDCCINCGQRLPPRKET